MSPDGILVIMICSRAQKNLGMPTRAEISDRLINERVERVSRQLMRDLRRRAAIDQRSS